jgi:hypothetical protein
MRRSPPVSQFPVAIRSLTLDLATVTWTGYFLELFNILSIVIIYFYS